MTENIGFTLRGLNEYIEWQTEDKRKLKKINQLITDIIRNGNSGIGHPEPLKGNLANYWSQEIDEKNRLIPFLNQTYASLFLPASLNVGLSTPSLRLAKAASPPF
jgi:toxin YoeB